MEVLTNKLSVAPPPTTTVVWLSFTQAGYSNTKLLTVVGLGFFGFFFGEGVGFLGLGFFCVCFLGAFSSRLMSENHV